MKQRKSSGSGGPVANLLEFPQEGHSCEEHIEVVVDPMVSFHQSVSAFVAVEPVFDLQSRNNEVDQIEEQEN